MSAIHEHLIQTLRGFAQRHPVIQRMELFCSRARGENRPGSDVDLLVSFRPDAKVTLFDLGGLRAGLVDLLGCEVDLVERQAIEASSNPIRKNLILKEPVLIYDAWLPGPPLAQHPNAGGMTNALPATLFCRHMAPQVPAFCS